jgi:CRISPR-associated exonuclease Cas4
VTPTALLLLAAAALALLAVALLVRFRGAPRVVESDVGVAAPARVLRSARYGLSGKPDYLIEEHGRIVPVEVKPTRRSPRPWLRDVVQLAAYCLLLSEAEPRFGGYGYLRYASRTFRIDFTASLRDELLRTLAELRADLTAPDVDPNHHDPRRCARCSLVTVCGKVVTERR